MSTTTDLSTLKINYLTQEQYDTALANGEINANEFYITPQPQVLEATFSVDLISGYNYCLTIGPALNSSQVETLADQIDEVIG